jgi:hypothetical protein
MITDGQYDLTDVIEAEWQLREAVAAAEVRLANRNRLLRAHVEQGVPRAVMARALGLTKTRVGQICEGITAVSNQ